MSESTRPSHHPDDHELDEFLAGRGAVSQAYRQSRMGEAAPPELDAAVLQLAQQTAQRTQVTHPRWQSLRLPVALAATVVLSFSAFRMLREEPATTSTMAVAPATSAPASAEEILKGVAPPPVQAQKSAPKADTARSTAAPKKRMDKKEAGVQAPAATVGSPAVPQSELRYSEMDAAGSGAPSLARKAKPSAPPAVTAEGAMMNAAPAELSDQVTLAPEEWIRQIRELRDASQTQQARRQLQALLEVYPQFELPEDLKQLLPEPAASP